ncbi:hypothetical protein C2U70_27740 [Bradyrhizobium guangdongense]|uniref:hypothetical protein n=1 Tax=Bradyrhizobium guangdongense TaxID=1325090 RepID=UPI001128DDC2|nr:hypothetical protein [Bradyrhizobium guangdongense]TPQ29960.1 hypothetical protein C2U70_27740 [Bradyrhizobium guangdongense]
MISASKTTTDALAGRAKAPADLAVRRLDGIGHVLSDLDVAGARTIAQKNRVLMTLDMADKCVRVVVDEFRATPTYAQLVRKSDSLIGLIERTRSELISPRREGRRLS